MKRFSNYVQNSISEFQKYWDLLVLLVQRDIKLKYRRSVLGYLWSVLNPLLSMLVMSIVFTKIFKRSIENYPVYLICGNILFSFMRDATTQAIYSVISNTSLIKKAYVPKYIFTLSKVSSCLINFILSLGALLIVMIVTGVQFRWQNLLIIIPILELFVFCVGLGLFLAATTVFFRDIRNIWSIVTLAWMYMTPIFYSLEAFYNKNESNAYLAADTVALFIRRFNPMYMYIQQFRCFILQYSPVWEVPCSELMLRGAIVSVFALLAGGTVFNRTKEKFILYI